MQTNENNEAAERFLAPHAPGSSAWRVYTRNGEVARGLGYDEARALAARPSKPTTSIHAALAAIGAKIESREGDLYVQSSSAVRRVLAGYEFSGNVSEFVSEGQLWHDVPFAFDPSLSPQGRVRKVLDRLDRRLESQIVSRGADDPQAVYLVGVYHSAAGTVEQKLGDDLRLATQAAPDLRNLRRILARHQGVLRVATEGE